MKILVIFLAILLSYSSSTIMAANIICSMSLSPAVDVNRLSGKLTEYRQTMQSSSMLNPLQQYWNEVPVQSHFAEIQESVASIHQTVSELASVKNVFYPFSGIDIEGAFALFPDLENLYMVQLEPFGDLLRGFEQLHAKHYTFSDGPNAYGVPSFLRGGYGSTLQQEMATSVSGGMGTFLVLKVSEVLGGTIQEVRYIPSDTNAFANAFIKFFYKGKERRIFFFQSDVEELRNFDPIFPKNDFSTIFAAINTNNMISDFPKLSERIRSSTFIVGDAAAFKAGNPFSGYLPVINDPVGKIGYDGAIVFKKTP